MGVAEAVPGGGHAALAAKFLVQRQGLPAAVAGPAGSSPSTACSPQPIALSALACPARCPACRYRRSACSSCRSAPGPALAVEHHRQVPLMVSCLPDGVVDLAGTSPGPARQLGVGLLAEAGPGTDVSECAAAPGPSPARSPSRPHRGQRGPLWRTASPASGRSPLAEVHHGPGGSARPGCPGRARRPPGPGRRARTLCSAANQLMAAPS